MKDGDATILHSVHSNSPEAGLGELRQMWVAATDRDEAFEAVRKLVPEGHIVRLVMSHEAPSGAIDLELRPGEKRRYEELPDETPKSALPAEAGS